MPLTTMRVPMRVSAFNCNGSSAANNNITNNSIIVFKQNANYSISLDSIADTNSVLDFGPNLDGSMRYNINNTRVSTYSSGGIFSANGGGVTNLPPNALCTTNGAVNGSILEYTNGGFMLVPPNSGVLP